MDIALLIALSFAPGGFWLWFFLRLDIVRPSPRKLVALSFFLGMIATIPAGSINALALPDDLLSGGATITALAAGMLLVVGPVEETSKYLAVRLGALRSAYFQEPVDGLVYSTAAALGFASLENLLYVMQFGPAVMVGRALLSTVAHLVFAALWGYGSASARAEPGAGGSCSERCSLRQHCTQPSTSPSSAKRTSGFRSSSWGLAGSWCTGDSSGASARRNSATAGTTR